MADTWPVAQTIQQNQASTSNDLEGTYPLGAGGSSGNYPHYIRFTAQRTGSKDKTKNAGEVVLYMPPDALKTTYSQSIGDVEMGSAIQIAEGSKNIKEFGGSESASGFDNFLSMITGGSGVIADSVKSGALQLAVGALGAPVTAAIGKATGQILNPHKAVVYQGPGNFRTFSYTFVMVPKSAAEAEQIFKIVKFFKLRMHPEVGAGGIDAVKSLTLGYPDEFAIKYYVNKKAIDGSDPNKPLFRIHNCFLESFAADYTTSSLVSFIGDDQQPLTTTISLAFKETQLITKEDIRKGY